MNLKKITRGQKKTKTQRNPNITFEKVKEHNYFFKSPLNGKECMLCLSNVEMPFVHWLVFPFLQLVSKQMIFVFLTKAKVG